jgi:ATP:corrinoid adenosyltransferase
MALTLQQIKTLPGFENASDDEIISLAGQNGVKIAGLEPPPTDNSTEAPKPEEAGALRSYVGIPLLQGTADIGGTIGYGLEKSGIAPSMGQALQNSAHDVTAKLEARKSQAARDDHAKTLIDDNGNYGGYNLGTLAQDVFSSAPSTIAMGMAGAPLAKGVTAASKAIGIGEKAAKIASSGALGKSLAAGLDTAIGSSVGFGAAEGAYSGASNAAQIQHEIRNADINVLARHPAFIDTYHNETDQNLSVDERLFQTRDLMAHKAGDDVFANTLVKTGLISAITGGGVFGVVRGNAAKQAAGEAVDGAMKRAGKGFMSEGAQEGSQSAFEQRDINQAKRDYTDQNQDVNQGVLNAGLQGGIAGGVMGTGGVIAPRGSHAANDKPQDNQLNIETPDDSTGNTEPAGGNAERNHAAPGASGSAATNNSNTASAATGETGTVADAETGMDTGASPDNGPIAGNNDAATPDALILNAKGKPFADRKKADLKNKRLGGGYEVVGHESGFALKPINTETDTSNEEKLPQTTDSANQPEPDEQKPAAGSGIDEPVSATGPVADETASDNIQPVIEQQRENDPAAVPGPAGPVSGNDNSVPEPQQAPVSSWASGDGSGVSDVSILDQTRKKWIDTQLRAQGIGKSSRHYDKKRAEIDESYDTEMDKALASAPFETFASHPSNEGIPKSLLQDAHDALREEYGITEDAQKIEDKIKQQPSKSEAPKLDLSSESKGIASLRNMPIGTKEEAIAYTKAFDEFRNRYGTSGGNVRGKNWKPISVTHPDIFSKLGDATEKAELNYWQMPYEEATRRASFSNLPKSKWIAERKKRGLPVEEDSQVQQVAEVVKTETKPAKAAHPSPKAINDKDDLLAAISKLGGLSADEAQRQGVDPAHFNKKGSGIMRVFTKTGKNAKTYDEMAEALRQYGYDVPDASSLVDQVSRAVNQGEKLYTPKGHEHHAAIMAEEKVSEEQARHVQRLQALYETAQQHDSDFGTNFHDTLLKLDDLSDDNLSEWEQDLHDDRQSRAKTTDDQGINGDSKTQAPEEHQASELGSYTQQEITEREQRQKQLAAEEKTKEKQAKQKEEVAKTVDELPGQMLGDQGSGDIFGHTSGMEKVKEGEIPDLTEQKVAKPEAKNTVFTEDAAEKARALLRSKLGQLNSGIDPEIMQAGITLAGYHIEKGARSFSAYAKAMMDDLGDIVKPYLKSWYMAIAFDPRAQGFADEMTSVSEVEKINIDELFGEAVQKTEPAKQKEQKPESVKADSTEEPHAPSTDTNLESDSQNADAKESGNETTVPDGRSGNDAAAGPASAETGATEHGTGSDSSPAIDAAITGRKRGNKPVHSTEQPALSSELAPGVADSERGGNDSNAGIQAEPPASAEIKALVEQGNQKTAPAKRQVVQSDPDNIAATLPMLNDGQKADVLFAENRLADHKGVLFTNGTGTGKTFSALGIAKRFHLQGKKNIIVVVPSINIADQWKKAAKTFFDMDIGLLENTRTAGKGPVITTYANFGTNKALFSRDWDLVLADEAHKLMQSEDGKTTDALNALRGLTYHNRGFYPWFEAKYADVVQELKSARATYEAFSKDDTIEQLYRAANHRYGRAQEKYNEAHKKAKAEYDQLSKSPAVKVAFLSATPFAYAKTIDYAEGYLFEYGEGNTRDHYNAGNNQDQFFMQHFGYRMRYNKLTRPDENVDTGIMERQFNGTLRKTGALSFRSLDVNFDYDRKFVLVESAIGRRIDEAMEWIRKQKYQLLADELNEKFDYLQRRYLLEAIKAQEAIPIVKQHLALGRKALVFHDYKKGGAVNPFLFSSKGNPALAKQIADFNDNFGDLARSFDSLPSPINAFKAAFGDDVMVYNGDVSAKERIKLADQFNDDTSGKNLILVQSASAKEGVSFHDTTGKHQRVLLNIGLPTQPTTAIQQEGRIYRVGQQSDALFRYLNTGTNWERWAFASTIAQRASTAENLAAGEGARALKDAFINAFEESDIHPAGHEGEGKGGKAADKAAASALSEFDRAKSLYFGQQKKTARTKSAEGVDYFATAEPVGFKMVEIADIRPGDSSLEPSAGHGAIARWFRDDAKKTAVEPSGELGSRLALVFDGDIKRERFEDLNIINKYDVIVMNPPFGVGGKTAIEHLAKAAKHLRMNGRIVALIPEGPSADKRFDKFLYGEEERAVNPLFEHPALGPVYRGDTVKTRASWMPEGKLARIDKDGNAWLKREGSNSESMVAKEAWTEVSPTGKRKEIYRPADGLYLSANISLPTVAFERAGTNVKTRIVVIDKVSKDDAANIQQQNRDYSSAESIKELFERIENLSIRPRNVPQPSEESQPEARRSQVASENEAAKQADKAAQEASVIAESADKATFKLNGDKILTNAPATQVTTKKGKVLDGVFVPDESMAKAVDQFTYQANGRGNGWFVRLRHIERPSVQFSKSNQKTDSTIEQVKSWLPDRVKGLVDVGKLIVIQSADSVPQSASAFDVGGVEGYYDEAADKLYLVADMLNQDNINQVLLHELYHRAEATDEKLQAAIAKFNADLKRRFYAASKGMGSAIEQAAYKRVMAAGTKAADQISEFKAYMVSEWAKNPDSVTGKIRKAIADFVAAIRVALFRAGMPLKSLSPADLAALAKYGARVKSSPNGGGNVGVRYSTQANSQSPIDNISQQGDALLKSFLNQKNADTAIYNLQDRYIDLKRQMEKVVKQGVEIDEIEDAYMGEELYHQRAASRIKDFYDKEFTPILKALHDNGISLDTFQKFLHARHAPSRNEVMAERNPNQAIIEREYKRAKKELDIVQANIEATPKQLREAMSDVAKWERAKPFDGTEEERLSLSGMSNRESAEFLDSLPAEQRDVLDELGDAIDKINNETLDLTVSYGMEKPQTVHALKKQWQHYVPLHRDEAHPDDNNFGHPVGRGFSVRGSGLKNATGSNAEVTNIMAHIAASREQMIRRGEKNRVMMRLAGFVKTYADADFAEIGKVPMSDKLVNGLVESLPDTTYKNRDNVVLLRVKGRDVAVVFNESKPENVRLALSLKNMDGADLDKVESFIAQGTRFMAKFNTQYNIIFGLINLMRDTQGMMLNLSSTPLHGKQKTVFNNMGKALKIIYAVERGWQSADNDPALKKLYDRFNKAGGTTGYAQMFDGVSDRDHSIRNELSQFDAGRAKRTWRWIGKALTDYNTVMENSTRLAVFMTGIEAGLSDDRAASIAKNITVNFNRKGAYTTKMGAFYAFFNASMQGSARMAETMAGPKGKQILLGGVGLGAALTLLGIASMGEDDWEKIPEFVRERSLIMPAPWNDSGYVSIPMPLGFHILPNIGRKLVEAAFGSKRVSPAERLTQLAGSTVGAFNPLGGSDLIEFLMPTVLDPVVALGRNKDWTGRTIYREDFNSLKPTPGFTRAKDTASTWSKFLTEHINKLTGGTDYKAGKWSPTPDQIDYVFGQLFGGTGREVMKLDEAVSSLLHGEELPTHKIPLIGRLYGETSGNSVERSTYYDNIRMLNEHAAEIKGLRQEQGGSKKVAAYLRENPEARLTVSTKGLQTEVDKLNDRRRELAKRGAPSTTLRALDDRIGNAMKRLNDQVAEKLGD